MNPANANLPQAISMLPGDISEPLQCQDGFELLLLVSRKAPAAGKEDPMMTLQMNQALTQKVMLPIVIYSRSNTKLMTQQQDGQPIAE